MGQKGILEPKIVVVGRIGAPYGVKGWVHIQSFTQPIANLLEYQPWYLMTAGKWQVVCRIGARIQSNGIVACLEGFKTRDAAVKLLHLDIGVERAAFKTLESGEYYWSDLIGLKVINEEGVELGIVTTLLETGSNDVLVVKGESKEFLIPYIQGDYVLVVDLTSQIIQVSWDSEF